MVQARVGSEGTVGMMVRMSEDLRDRIKAAAEANGRSQNSEIVAALEAQYPKPSKFAVIAQAIKDLATLADTSPSMHPDELAHIENVFAALNKALLASVRTPPKGNPGPDDLAEYVRPTSHRGEKPSDRKKSRRFNRDDD